MSHLFFYGEKSSRACSGALACCTGIAHCRAQHTLWGNMSAHLLTFVEPRALFLSHLVGALTQMCPPFRLRLHICWGVIGGMLTQHEVCLDVSDDTTLGYRLPASCELAVFCKLCLFSGMLNSKERYFTNRAFSNFRKLEFRKSRFSDIPIFEIRRRP